MPWVDDAKVRGQIMQAGFGRGFGFWAAALSLQVQRIEALLAAWDEMVPLPYTVSGQERLNDWALRAQADAHYLVLGVRHVIRHAFKFRDLIGKFDPRITTALDTFATEAGEKTETIKNLRDSLEHWDEWSFFLDKPYQGKLKRPPDLIAGQPETHPRNGDLYVGHGGVEIPAIQVARAAMRLASELGESLRDAISPPGIAPGGVVFAAHGDDD